MFSVLRRPPWATLPQACSNRVARLSAAPANRCQSLERSPRALSGARYGAGQIEDFVPA